MYGQSAEIYDLLYTGTGIKDFAAEAAELHEIVETIRPGTKSWLDVGCGTGALLAEMGRWYAVEGVDISPAMLGVARRRLPGVELIEADLRAFDLGRTFDVVTCLFSSIGYVIEAEDLAPAVARLAAHVAPGGVLVLDGWLRPDAWSDTYRAEPEVADDQSTTVVRLVLSRRLGDVTELDMHYLVRTAAGIDYFSEVHRLRLTPTEEYVAAVEAAGMKSLVSPDYMPGRDRIIGLRL